MDWRDRLRESLKTDLQRADEQRAQAGAEDEAIRRSVSDAFAECLAALEEVHSILLAARKPSSIESQGTTKRVRLGDRALGVALAEDGMSIHVYGPTGHAEQMFWNRAGMFFALRSDQWSPVTPADLIGALAPGLHATA